MLLATFLTAFNIFAPENLKLCKVNVTHYHKINVYSPISFSVLFSSAAATNSSWVGRTAGFLANLKSIVG
jgi:hypothetical protein